MLQPTGWKRLSRILVVLGLTACTAIQAPTPTPIDPRQPLPTAAVDAAGTAEAPAAETTATPAAEDAAAEDGAAEDTAETATEADATSAEATTETDQTDEAAATAADAAPTAAGEDAEANAARGAADTEAANDETANDDAEELSAASEELYVIHCAACHQLHGNGTSAYPPLAGSGLVNAAEPTGVIAVILQGRGHMPAFADTLADQEVAAVASFIRTEWENNAAAVSAEQVSAAQESAGETAAADDTADEAADETADESADTTDDTADQEAAAAETGDDADTLISAGAEVYAANCASCHQSEGDGTGAYPALAGSQLVTDEDPSAVIEIVLHGQGEMPAFADTLDEEAIAAVVSYIRNSWENEAAAVSVDQLSGDASEAAPAEAEATPEAEEGEAAEAEAPPAATTPESEAKPAEAEATPVGETAEAEATPAPATAPASEVALLIRGDEIYRIACAACHQPSGQGTDRYPALAGSAVVLAAEPVDAITLVLHGQGEMPAFADTLAHQEIAAVLTHIRNTWGQHAAPVTVDQVAQAQNAAATPAAETAAETAATPEVDDETATPADTSALINAGEAVYASNCAACHQLHGQGTSAYPALDGSALVTADDATATIGIVLHGQGQMPAFADLLDDEEVAAVVSYVRNAWENAAAPVEVAQVSQVNARTGETGAVAND